MATQSGDTRLQAFEEVRYGKPVRSEYGPLHEDALYGVNSATPGIENPLKFIPASLIGSANLTPNMIDPEYTRRGALVVKAVQEGLAIMRLRYRAEAGEGEGGRHFLLSRMLLIPGITFWHDIPSGLFSWCENSFNAYPFVFGQPSTPDVQKIELPRSPSRDVNWYDGLSRHRQIQLGSAVQAITRRVGWAVSGMVAEEENRRPASLIANDLDVIASLPRKFPLRLDNKDQFILNLGLEPDLTPGAVSYFPGHRGSAIEAPDLQALRVAIISGETRMHAEEKTTQPARLCDSLDRQIGKDPIPLRWTS